jgi:hypothetical protein
MLHVTLHRMSSSTPPRRRRPGVPRAMPPGAAAPARSAKRTAEGRYRWLVFAHQLPAHPSNGRVKTWRRLQQIGAVPVKNSVYVLPNTEQAREDFEWLRTEVVSLGGQASIFEASSIDRVDERRILKQLRAAATQQSDSERHPLRAPAEPGESVLDPRGFQHRVWVTRPRPGVDRFSSAWFIRRFIDPKAAFLFASSPDRRPEAVPFDMYQPGGFKHEGDRCTFEVLSRRFGVADAAVRRIAEIVHDLDLKDDRFKAPQAATIDLLVEGLRASVAEDAKLLELGIAMFEALYQSFSPSKGPRGVKPKVS